MRRPITALIAVALAILLIDRLWIALTEPPTVGHFRSSEGRATYVDAYQRALAEGPAPERTMDIPTSFGTAHVYAWNLSAPGTPVVLIPGRASGAPMWNELLPALSDDHPIYTIDAIGDAGLSVQSAPITSGADQARWLAETIEGIGATKAHVVGHSFGGATATALAMESPEVVASLTLLEPVFVFEYPPLSTFLWSTVIMSPAPQSWIDHGLAEIGGTTVEDVQQRTPVSEMIDAGSQHYSAHLPTPSRPKKEQLHSLTMPVYVGIADTSSLAGGEKAVRRAQELLPNGTVEMWPNTTHSLPFQAATPLGAELGEFWRASEDESLPNRP